MNRIRTSTRGTVARTHRLVSELLAKERLRSYPIGVGVSQSFEIVLEIVVQPANEPKYGLELV